MTKAGRKRLFSTVRIAACVGALWIVAQGVTYYDHVTLTDGKELVGRAVDRDGRVEVTLLDGTTLEFSEEDLAKDEQGNARMTFGLRTSWSASDKALLLLAILIHFPIIVLQALRFQWLLRAQSIALGLWESIKLSFAGNFLNFATPLGSNAGDVFKAYFLSLHTDRKTEAVTTVFLDRVVGLASLMLVVTAITTFSPSDSPLADFRPYLLAMLAVGIGSAVVYFAPPFRKHIITRLPLERLPMFDHLRRVDQAMHTLARKKGTVVATLALTMFLQATAMTAYFTVAKSLQMRVDLSNILECYTYFGTGIVVQTLPGPPQGLGTVELAYRYFFANLGSPSQIVCMALAVRLVVLICALPGLLVAMTGSYRPKELAAFAQKQEASHASVKKTTPPCEPNTA